MDPATTTPTNAGTAAPKLRVAGVTKSFLSEDGATVEVLKPITIDIAEGEYVVLFGPSGCGKSTLLNLIAGFDHPDEGEIVLDGEAVTRPGHDRLMMFQEHALFPWLKVVDNVAYGLRWRPGFRFRPALRRKKAVELLKLVHLEDFAKSSIHELSGGMKQRVALARALAPDPKVLLIDEPFPALDALVRAKLYDELQEILISTKKTIVSVTHDPREAACLADRVLVMSPRPGRIQEEIRIDLPRPRDINDGGVSEYAAKITALLEDADATGTR